MNDFFFDKDNCLVNIANSILKNFTGESFNNTSSKLDEVFAQKRYDKVCLLLFDGFGKSIREKHLSEGDFLRKKKAFTITSVFPPTTVAATTAVCSGKFPKETGWMGWRQYFKNHGLVVDMFTNANSITHEKIPGPYLSSLYCEYTPIWNYIKEKGINSGFVQPYPIDPAGPHSIDEWFETCDALMKKSGPHYYYMYWAEPDKSIHTYGCNDVRIKRICKDINKRVAKLAKDNKDNLIIVLSDHSMIDTKYFYFYEHEDFYSMCETIFSLDARSAMFHVKEEYKDKFKDVFNKYYGKYFILKSKQEINDENWFGVGTPHPMYESFLGDFMATSISEYGFTYETDYHLIGNHAGNTSEESLIDVSIINR